MAVKATSSARKKLFPRGRKGVFFTLMALLIVAFLITNEKTLNTPYTVLKSDTEFARMRVSVMNTYLTTFEQQATNSLRVAGYMTLKNLSWNISYSCTLQTGKPCQNITNMNLSVNRCINATNYAFCMNQSYAFNNTMAPLINLAYSTYGISTSYRIQNVWVTEENPFEVVFHANMTFNISDAYATWNSTDIINATVDVTGIDDPVYLFAAGKGRYTPSSGNKTFNKTSLRLFEFNSTNFIDYYYFTNSYVSSLGMGPSVLQRYQGQLNGSSICCGIESVVRKGYIPGVNIYNTTSLVDYLYFQNATVQFNCSLYASNQNGYPVNTLKGNSGRTIDQYLRLDTNHLLNIYRFNATAGEVIIGDCST